MAQKGYRVVRDFAGVKHGRASSFISSFAEANRAAMKVCGDLGKPVEVHHYDSPMGRGDLIVRYTLGPSGRPMVELAGEPSMPPGTTRG
jgi:hypothetical protein